jgi:phosphate/phosphite/phosphonate ABC transporter binding protein
MKRLQNRNRRRFLRAAAALPLPFFTVGNVIARRARADLGPLRFGMTPAFLHDQHALLDDWRFYMTRHLGKQVEFTQRDRYRETMDLLRLNQLDFAWLCVYPYLHLRHLLRLLVVPVYQGKSVYYSYLIVNAKDRETASIGDLRGKFFAYADPYSNSGYLVPRYRIHLLGEDPASFFKKTFFTWSHRKVVEAVASGLAQGAAVDSYVWDTLAILEPELTAHTRIVWRSPAYGFPPMVALANDVDEADFRDMQRILLDMPERREGRKLLGRLNLDGFSIQQPSLYDSVASMMRDVGEYDAS